MLSLVNITLPLKSPMNVVALTLPLTSNSKEGFEVPIPTSPSIIKVFEGSIIIFCAEVIFNSWFVEISKLFLWPM